MKSVTLKIDHPNANPYAASPIYLCEPCRRLIVHALGLGVQEKDIPMTADADPVEELRAALERAKTKRRAEVLLTVDEVSALLALIGELQEENADLREAVQIMNSQSPVEEQRKARAERDALRAEAKQACAEAVRLQEEKNAVAAEAMALREENEQLASHLRSRSIAADKIAEALVDARARADAGDRLLREAVKRIGGFFDQAADVDVCRRIAAHLGEDAP